MTMDLSLFEEHFHISASGCEHPLLSVPAAELLDEKRMREALELGSSLTKGVGLELAVSFIGISFFGLAATKQIVMSQYGKILDLSLDNLTVQLEAHDDHAHVIFKYNELKWTDLPAEGRDEAIRAEWTRYFAETMNPLIEAAARAAGLKPALIWNQYGARIAYVMEYLRGIVPEGALRRTMEDDCLLLAGMPGETFNRRKNPYVHTPVYIDSPYEPGGQIMIRSACCMYYKRENGTKCYTCPILKEQDRAEMKLLIEAQTKEQSA